MPSEPRTNQNHSFKRCAGECLGLSALLEGRRDKQFAKGFDGKIGHGIGILLQLNTAQHGLHAVRCFGRFEHFVNLFETLQHVLYQVKIHLVHGQLLLTVLATLIIVCLALRNPVLSLLIVLRHHFLVLIEPVRIIRHLIDQFIEQSD